jgi:hypothetical protein
LEEWRNDGELSQKNPVPPFPVSYEAPPEFGRSRKLPLINLYVLILLLVVVVVIVVVVVVLLLS